MPFIGTQPRAGAYSLLDSITVTATDTFNLTLDGAAYYPQSPNHLLVSINGSIQAPQNSFTISGSQIIFSENLLVTDVIDFIIALGDVLSIGTPSDGTVTSAKLADGAVTTSKIASNLSLNGNLSVDTDTLYVDSTNNRVGIGTSNPSVALEVGTSSSQSESKIYTAFGGGYISLNNSSVSNANPLIELQRWSGTPSLYYGFQLEADNSDFKISTSNAATLGSQTFTERMRINSSGNVGIGTSSPAYGLHVSGTGLKSYVRVSNTTGAYNAKFNVEDTGETTIGSHSNNPFLLLTNNTERMRLDTSGNLLFNSGYGSVATAYGCRAWVQFNGVGTPTIRASGNVSSITDNGTGLYTINFATAMPDANYCTIGSSIGSTTSADGMIVSGTAGGASVSTGAIQVRMAYAPSNGATDITHVNVAVFR